MHVCEFCWKKNELGKSNSKTNWVSLEICERQCTTSPARCISWLYCATLPVLFDSCNVSSKNHMWTHACAHAHTHTHTYAHTHTRTHPLSVSHTHIYTRQHTVYIFRYIHNTKYHSIYTEQTLGGYFCFILAYCSLAHILVIPMFTWGRIMKLWMHEGCLLYMMNACLLNKLV